MGPPREWKFQHAILPTVLVLIQWNICGILPMVTCIFKGLLVGFLNLDVNYLLNFFNTEPYCWKNTQNYIPSVIIYFRAGFFHSMSSRFGAAYHFETIAPDDQKITLNTAISKVQPLFSTSAPSPNLQSICLYGSPFRVTGNFETRQVQQMIPKLQSP